MRSWKKTLAVAVITPTLALSASCGGTQNVNGDEVVGRPPTQADKLSPTKTSKTDTKRQVGEKVTPHKLKPAVTDEGEQGGEQGGEPEGGDAEAPEGEMPGAGRPSAAPGPGRVASAKMGPDMLFEGETHLRNLKKITAGGQNAEAYFNPAETHFVFQATVGDRQCDQIYIMDIHGEGTRMVSTGKGVTTCGYFMPDGQRVLFSSTHEGGDACPPKPDFRQYGGYVWPIHDTYDIYTADLQGQGLKALTNQPGYDAEATLSPKGDRIVFTSTRDGDLDIYTMNIDGSDVKRLTSTLGYDGGAFFSHDGRQIVFRAHHITDEAEARQYKRLLAEGVVKPSVMEIYVMNADGSNLRQVTRYGAASFGPFFHPSGEWIIFSSNLHDPQGRDFELYMVRTDGSKLTRITYNPTFDGFPMFTADGKKLVFASNRANSVRGETNVFISDWDWNP